MWAWLSFSKLTSKKKKNVPVNYIVKFESSKGALTINARQSRLTVNMNWKIQDKSESFLLNQWFFEIFNLKQKFILRKESEFC